MVRPPNIPANSYYGEEEKTGNVDSPVFSHRLLARQALSLSRQFEYAGDKRRAWEARNAARKMLSIALKEEELWQNGLLLSEDVKLLARSSKNSFNTKNLENQFSSQAKRKKAGPVDIRGSECIISIPQMRYILNELRNKISEPKEVI